MTNGNTHNCDLYHYPTPFNYAQLKRKHTLEDINLISNIISAVGLFMLIVSLILYVKRTKDTRALIQFWAKKENLVNSELLINRVGLIVVLIGVFLPEISNNI